MGEERVWAELNQVKTDVQGIRSDVTDIKDALLGDKFGNKGYSGRIDDLEIVCENVDDEIKISKTYRKIFTWVVATLIGSGGIFSIVKFIFPLITK